MILFGGRAAATVMFAIGLAGCGSAQETTPATTAANTEAAVALQARSQLLHKCLADEQAGLTMAHDMGFFEHGTPTSIEISKSYADVDALKLGLGGLLREANPSPEQQELVNQDVAALSRLQQSFLNDGEGGNIGEALRDVESVGPELVALPHVIGAICKVG